ncbi:MAG: hypothetical protein H7Z42_21185 [Roseiflexaceae bacterium]|nr:hypothetical protein [Roseiflexaceae bacterium]
MAIGALTGAVIGFAAVFTLIRLERSLGRAIFETNPLALLVILIGSWLLAILVHELGHLIAGMLGGMRPLLLVVGPLRVQREGDRLRVGFNRSLALAGGIAACAPPDDRNLRRRMAWMIAGGPVASLLLALAGAGLVALQNNSTLDAIGLVLAFMSGLICAVTLLPLRSGGFNSDGARLLMLARGGPTVDRYLANLALVASSLGGVRPRDWNPSLVEHAQAVPDDTIDHRSAQLMAYSHTLDQGDIQQAGTLLDDILANLDDWPAPFRPSVLLEAAYYAARHRQQPLQARQQLDQATSGTLVAPSTRLSAEATVLLAEGRAAEAAAKAEAGIRALNRAIDAGSALVERERLEAVIAGYTIDRL